MSNQPMFNDDDLFSYDPSLDLPKDKVLSSNSFAKDNSEILNNISKKFVEDKDEDFNGSLGSHIKMAYSVITAYSDFVKIDTLFFHKSIYQSLDRLTNGSFSLLYSYNFLENNLIRRINIKFLLESVFYAEGINAERFKEFTDKLGVRIDSHFINSYIDTNIEINDHIINNERAMYLRLAKKLNIEPNHLLVMPNPSIEDLINLIDDSLADYHTKFFNLIQSSHSDYTEDLSLLCSSEVKISAL